MTPSASQTPLQLVVSHASTGNLEAAKAIAATIVDKANSAEAWACVARVNANMQRFEEALSAIDTALGQQPGSRPLRLERARLLALCGLADPSLRELESLTLEAADSPELLVDLALALRFAGRDDEAEARLTQGLERWPAHAALHEHLARLRYARNPAEHFTQTLEQAIGDFPGEMQLRLVAAGLLRNAGQAERALELLREGLRRAPHSAAFLTSVGVLLDERDGSAEALASLRAAVQRAPHSAQMKRNLIPALLRRALDAEARALCEELLLRDPDDQKLIAYHATALRMSGDARYAELHDYPRLVRVYRPAPPAAFPTIGDFNAAFARELSRLHRTDHHPLDQSLRGGSQTERNLPADNPVIAGFFSLVDAPIRDYIARLRDGDRSHPTDRRKSAGYRISGSWSVRLMPGGFHVNHVHPRGWISSAYYVELPAMQDARAQAGWLKFGEPDDRYPGCTADHLVEPAAGMLVLFPSYLWHGTVPFEQGGRRLTAAFDVIPD
ncbi:MAG TPA: putative 2OG-Fe(II) oxygenase [Steroidobacteraceae bacterium]|nr:putative 2OG-Fe(II) oxygenase [Steroidobacteraceae bacterium]